MKKALAVAVVLAGSSAAWAGETPFPNGTFEAQGSPGFTQTIENWSVTYTGAPDPGLSWTQQSGLFSTLGKFSAPQGSTFAFLSNLGGSGRVELASNGLGGNFALNGRSHLKFRYAYLTNDPAWAATHDRFTVQIDFYASAGAVAPSNTQVFEIDAVGALNDTTFSPFDTAGGSTFNNGPGAGPDAYNLVDIDMSPFLAFGTFARVSFIVDNNGPAAGTNGNGLGVSGVVLDNVVVNPEPSAVALFALGAMGLGGFAWRRRGVKKPAA